jgi:hypothetical protein
LDGGLSRPAHGYRVVVIMVVELVIELGDRLRRKKRRGALHNAQQQAQWDVEEWQDRKY